MVLLSKANRTYRVNVVEGEGSWSVAANAVVVGDGVRPRGAPNKKLADAIADRFEKEIEGNGWVAGHSLGSEGELLEKHHVGRNVLREA